MPETDLRELIPKIGLKEYWYPALRDKQVGWKKPVALKMLGQDVCFFRAKSGEVVAVANACPHRGAMLGDGDCTFRGYVTCFYHGFTFDERGECVAALGEGPESPMPGNIRVRVYPTVTLKGMVFAWMGEGEPAPLEQSIPDEFFDAEALVLNWVNVWPCNWRPALENSGDSHFRVLHRNSARVLMRPIPPPVLPQNGRPTVINAHRLRAVGQADGAVGQTINKESAGKPEYQHYYPGVRASWPLHRWRLLWTWLFDPAERRRYKRPYQMSQEWGPGQHLPSMFRQNWGTHVFTRWITPITERESRVFYFHAAKRTTWLSRLYEWLHFELIHNWLVNKNFSEQDARGSVRAYHDTPENLAPSDIQVTAWRKFLLTARGLRGEQPAGPGSPAADKQRQVETVHA